MQLSSKSPWRGLVAFAVILSLGLLGSCGEDGGQQAPAGESTPGPQQPAGGPASRPSTPASRPTSKEEPSTFTRMRRTGHAQGVLETAIVHYEDEQGRRVDLIGVVHVAEARYYDELEKRFEDYDALLYELVASKGTRPTPGGGRDSIVSRIQKGLKSMLALEFQLEAIDYHRPNFVHADLDPKGFSEAMRANGETMFSMMVRLMMAGQKAGQEQGTATYVELLASLFAADRAQYLKFVLAKQLESMDEVFAAMGQGDKGQRTVLIGARNEACMDVLDQQMAKGKKKLAIFYGSGHMPDLEERLWKRGFSKKNQEWLIAWDARLDEKDQKAEEAEPADPAEKEGGR